jgi:AraC family transcriptional regulator
MWQLSGGQFCIVGPGFPHDAEWEKEASFAVVHIAPSFLRRIIKNERLKGVHVRDLAALSGQDHIATLIISIFRSLCEDSEEQDHDFIAVLGRALAGRLIKGLLETIQNAGSRDDRLTRTQQRIVIAYMNSHLDRRIPTVELARLVGVCPSHFMRTFKNTTGTAAGQFHLLRRLRQAEETLLGTDDSIAEVAAQFGFADQNHFTRRFHSYLKYSPSALMRLRKSQPREIRLACRTCRRARFPDLKLSIPKNASSSGI